MGVMDMVSSLPLTFRPIIVADSTSCVLLLNTASISLSVGFLTLMMSIRDCGRTMAFSGDNTPPTLPKIAKSFFATGETFPMLAAPIPFLR